MTMVPIMPMEIATAAVAVCLVPQEAASSNASEEQRKQVLLVADPWHDNPQWQQRKPW